MLPKAVLDVQLVENAGTVTLRVTPQVVGDPRHAYLLDHLTSAFSSDELKIDLDDTKTMLSKVKIKTTDTTLDFLKEISSIAGARQSERSGPGEWIVYTGTYDPDQPPESEINARTMVRLHDALQLAMLQWKQECSSDSSDKLKCATADKLSTALEKRGDKSIVTISATPMIAAVPKVAVLAGAVNQTDLAAPPKANCAEGICHRAMQPFLIELGIEGLFYQNTVAMLPNGGDPIVVPLNRAAFVTTEYEVVLEKGQLKSFEEKRPSSALALVKWPLDVYRAFLEATSTFIQLRIGASTKEVELAQSNLTTATELKRILQEQKALEGKTGERSSMNGTGSGLLAIDLSVRKQQAQTPGTGPGQLDGGDGGAGQPSLPPGRRLPVPQTPQPSNANN